MTPAAVYRSVGMLDGDFLLGHDDIDWALRLRDAGYELRVIGEPLVRHKVSVSAGVRGSNVLQPLQAYHYARGSMLVAAKHRRGWRTFPYIAGQVLIRLPFYTVQMLRARRPGGVPSYLHGLQDGYREFVRPGREKRRSEASEGGLPGK
jgi:GT2 family glycosyltransferase